MSLKNLEIYKSHIQEYGFTVINTIFSPEEIDKISCVLENIDQKKISGNLKTCLLLDSF
ncbi:hypothetical protein J2787_003124 [Chryseobacterium rhizosphaerae]|uniref:Phytanoyl-CoA dioxygenase n=1 Tax=Chryseobacterium rhizosphaerae TaxID=395937 RepID=A0AAE4C455_9FLAO|nr:hypothetical protein [Chryseobacterium rhizosphaerae]